MSKGAMEHLVDENNALRDEVASLKRRMRLMLTAARAGYVTLSDMRDWYISDLANLRRKLPRRAR